MTLRRVSGPSISSEKICVVSLDAHFFDILRIAGEHKLNMVAVNNEEGQYAE